MGVKSTEDLIMEDKLSVREQVLQKLKEAILPDKLKLDFKNTTYDSLNELKAIKEVLHLLDIYDWRKMYSVYTTDGKRQIVIWEQNSDGKIRNKETWNLQD